MHVEPVSLPKDAPGLWFENSQHQISHKHFDKNQKVEPCSATGESSSPSTSDSTLDNFLSSKNLWAQLGNTEE